jgi:hypothetical protein
LDSRRAALLLSFMLLADVILATQMGVQLNIGRSHVDVLDVGFA